MTTPAPEIPRESRRQAFRYWLAERKAAVAGWVAVVVLSTGFVGLYFAGQVDPLRIERPDTTFGTKAANLIEQGNLGPDVEVGAVGKGLTRTYIIRKKGLAGAQPAVVFLHGFGSSLVVGYEPWIEHLARQGLTVIFPAWQQPPFPTDGSQNPRTNMFDGVELAVKAVPVQENKVAVLGFSAGAALAFDYAALAGPEDVPKARLVYSIYPGRAFPGQTKPILPIPSVTGMEPDAKVVTLVSRKDKEAGTKWGLEQYAALAGRGAELRELVYVTKKGLTDHYAPADYDSKARRVFWQPFDRLLTSHLGVQRIPDEAVSQSARQQHLVEDQLERESLLRRKAQRGTSSLAGESTTDIGATPDPTTP